MISELIVNENNSCSSLQVDACAVMNSTEGTDKFVGANLLLMCCGVFMRCWVVKILLMNNFLR